MFKNIVIPIDLADKHFSHEMLPVVLSAIAPYDAKINLAYIIPNFGSKAIEEYLPKNWVRDQKARYIEKLQNLAEKYTSKDAKVSCYIGRGAIYDELIKYSTDIGADLIAVSAVRPQRQDYMLGSNASKIVRHAGISVMVVRE